MGVRQRATSLGAAGFVFIAGATVYQFLDLHRQKGTVVVQVAGLWVEPFTAETAFTNLTFHTSTGTTVSSVQRPCGRGDSSITRSRPAYESVWSWDQNTRTFDSPPTKGALQDVRDYLAVEESEKYELYLSLRTLPSGNTSWLDPTQMDLLSGSFLNSFKMKLADIGELVASGGASTLLEAAERGHRYQLTMRYTKDVPLCKSDEPGCGKALIERDYRTPKTQVKTLWKANSKLAVDMYIFAIDDSCSCDSKPTKYLTGGFCV